MAAQQPTIEKPAKVRDAAPNKKYTKPRLTQRPGREGETTTAAEREREKERENEMEIQRKRVRGLGLMIHLRA